MVNSYLTHLIAWATAERYPLKYLTLSLSSSISWSGELSFSSSSIPYKRRTMSTHCKWKKANTYILWFSMINVLLAWVKLTHAIITFQIQRNNKDFDKRLTLRSPPAKQQSVWSYMLFPSSNPIINHLKLFLHFLHWFNWKTEIVNLLLLFQWKSLCTYHFP